MTAELEPLPAPVAQDDSAPLQRRLMAVWLLMSVSFLSLAFAHTVLIGSGGEDDLGLWEQDFPVLLGIIAVFATFRLVPQVNIGVAVGRIIRRPALVLVSMIATTIAVSWLGHRFALRSFAYSRDEDLALFQAALIAKGHLVGKASPEWAPFATAIQHFFMVPIPGTSYWLSGYLPVNSGLQAIGIALRLDGVISPLLAALSLILTYMVARKLWPQNHAAAFLAATFLLTSAQFLVTAMTAYAMNAHLALNMLWLWLFLREDRRGHIGAACVGFLATGLHQIIFHPLFVAPFVLDLYLARRWRSALFYTISYAGIGLFWIIYWAIVLHAIGARASAEPGGSAPAIHQALALVSAFDLSGLGMMAKNLLRFMTWQQVLAAPLLILSAVPAFRSGGILRSLLLGIVLTTASMFILLPAQGSGWGYRYLHGCLGSTALLACFGWMRLTSVLSTIGKRQAAALLVASFVFSLLLVPLRTWQAHDFVHPFVVATRHIERTKADVVLVVESGFWGPTRLVHNDPDLAHRPITMPLSALSEPQLKRMCAAHLVAVFQASDAARFGIRTMRISAGERAAREQRVTSRLKSLGCRITRIS